MLSRRRFLVWVSSAVPVALVARRADAFAAEWIAGDDETLRALAEVVLPSELSRDGAARVTRDFQRWIDNYRDHAELVHGYGTSALRYARPSNRVQWAAQLEEIGKRDAGSGKRFAQLAASRRRAIVAAELGDTRLDRLPDVASASHVAVALMAFYFGSSEAADLAYGAKIEREQCRPLATSSRKPLPLADART